ncbi:permease prefix domain 1-containing protein [Actinomadura sp. 9N407]|uniref:permease prefix domain 1-containing protein n=1 Tax=Actinomadura sp. 9N407 TaxID=3375154 RepID=UPI0037BBB620
MSAVADPIEDPVEDYAAELADALHGPARAKERMVREIRDGLADTVAAYRMQGMPYERAARLAVHEFGTVGEVAPSCQPELTIAQTRHTARAVGLTIPFLIACSLLIRTAGQGWALWLPVGAAATAALLGAATLAVTGTLARRLPMPARLPLAIAWTGTTTGVVTALAAPALAIASAVVADWPLTVLAGALAAASHAMVAGSARACRRCARLPVA